MKIPRPEDIAFSPLLWKESIASDSDWQTVDDYYSSLLKHLEEQRNTNKEWLAGIETNVNNKRIKKLINGYAILDILYWDNQVDLLHYKMWQLFEDLVQEILKEALRDKPECTVVHVDKLKGFKGLDFVITNSSRKDVWKVGVQCKKYVGSDLPKSRIEQYGPWTKGTTAPNLAVKGRELHQRFPKKKFVLATFNAFRTNEKEKKRFDELKDAWDCVMVFDKSLDTQTPYTYKIRLPELSRIEEWA
jgi:hypothetical protein